MIGRMEEENVAHLALRCKLFIMPMTIRFKSFTPENEARDFFGVREGFPRLCGISFSVVNSRLIKVKQRGSHHRERNHRARSARFFVSR